MFDVENASNGTTFALLEGDILEGRLNVEAFIATAERLEVAPTAAASSVPVIASLNSQRPSAVSGSIAQSTTPNRSVDPFGMIMHRGRGFLDRSDRKPERFRPGLAGLGACPWARGIHDDLFWSNDYR